MSQIHRQRVRVTSDFSISRILAEDHSKQSCDHSYVSKNSREQNLESISRRGFQVTGINDSNAFSCSTLTANLIDSRGNPALHSSSLTTNRSLRSAVVPFGGGGDNDKEDDALDYCHTLNSSGLHQAETIASQASESSNKTISSFLPSARDPIRNLKIDRSELSWLQCTRYRPPKLPRKSVAGKSGKRRPGVHPRIPFTSSQLQVLEDKYRRTAYLSRRDVIQLSTTLRLPQSRVKIWFQNRRARDRRETSVSDNVVSILSSEKPKAVSLESPMASNTV